MNRLTLPTVLDASRRVLIAGAGGGFDVFSGLPLYFALRARGIDVHLANLSFTYLGGTDAERFASCGYTIDARTDGPRDYFPEKVLAEFLSGRGERDTVYAFEKVGVAPLREAFAALVDRLKLDAIILVDGGTDILMRGDEAALGTPAEDMVSLAAVSTLDVPTRLVSCLGFGIDAFHGVCHAHFLENVSAIVKDGGLLGSQLLLPEMPEAAAYLDGVAYSEQRMPGHPSIVNTSIASAIAGEFGDFHRTSRTRSNTLFINPLMSAYWMFDLAKVARRSLYLQDLLQTQTIWDVQLIIEAMRHEVTIRPRVAIPH